MVDDRDRKLARLAGECPEAYYRLSESRSRAKEGDVDSLKIIIQRQCGRYRKEIIRKASGLVGGLKGS